MKCDNKQVASADSRRPSLGALVGFFVLAFLILAIVARLGSGIGWAANGPMSFVTAFLLGLVAAASSCMAVSGGLLMAITAKYGESMPGSARSSRIRPTLLFVGGRIASYSLLGGLIGYLGKGISFSPLTSGIVTVAAAIVMLALGLDMLRLLPRGLKRLLPSVPSSISRRVMGAEGSTHPAAPFLLGAGTFFLPCGFTQALQFYALSSGGFLPAASVLGGFALGTAPALIALGYFTGSLKGNAGRFFFRLAGAAVVILGVASAMNGLNLVGWPSAPASDSIQAPEAAKPDHPAWSVGSGNARSETLVMAIGPSGYSPSSFTVKAGSRIRWEIDAKSAAGCAMAIVSRGLGIQEFLVRGANEIEFTAPEKPGTYAFSCPMGMYRGEIIVTSF